MSAIITFVRYNASPLRWRRNWLLVGVVGGQIRAEGVHASGRAPGPGHGGEPRAAAAVTRAAVMARSVATPMQEALVSPRIWRTSIVCSIFAARRAVARLSGFLGHPPDRSPNLPREIVRDHPEPQAQLARVVGLASSYPSRSRCRSPRGIRIGPSGRPAAYCDAARPIRRAAS